ncbi:MAG: hypothetical protein O7F08_09205 [Deltaproteobacteria bacterium]|nr:hypothetical protein [Deltaproteobacteria bacterium]
MPANWDEVTPQMHVMCYLLAQASSFKKEIFEHRDPVVGDIVWGCTPPTHRYTIARVLEVRGMGDLLVQELGTDQTCHYSNEIFRVITAEIPDRLFWSQAQHEFRRKVSTAIGGARWLDSYWYRVRGMRWPSSNHGIAIIGAHIWMSRPSGYEGTELLNFEVDLGEFKARTTITSIAETLKAAGLVDDVNKDNWPGDVVITTKEQAQAYREARADG